ncbi:1,4-alpha-glucan branching enzyme [Lysobacter spongiicola DSM 21749]|uniref:1,4-alpha-glucan branching enzyme GlgB n=2 Tax=Novilysobacter TaxID=3382699 RepID=A0A1T4M766_9GAMM|nr:1,4-alpha-glucan branching enzyme [Lysobacter spongiicola DSM 21749]
MKAKNDAPHGRMPDWVPDPQVVQALARASHGDPFSVLGPHHIGDTRVVRVWAPGAESVSVVARGTGETHSLESAEIEPALFGGPIGDGTYELGIKWPGGIQRTCDPYSFGPLLGDLDLHLISEGRQLRLADTLGAQVRTVDGVEGVRFAVWAPNARRVSVVGDFNAWDGRRHPMRLRQSAGVWELFLPGLGAGARYKYEILGPDGTHLPLKADPVARATECPPATASIVAAPEAFEWTDGDWMDRRQARQSPDAPVSIYELHAGSWMRDEDGEPLDWDALAERLVPYVAGMGFTHVELLPVTEHPFGGSWGYQPLGLFAPTARHGSPEAFARFVDRCHHENIGVLLDWVPAHFPSDAHGLARFDGTPLYEHADPREGFHRDWNTLIYNHGRHEVSGFLVASALEWLERYHVDGLRVDAVASMLYRDYSRAADEWVPNVHGGRENYETIAFLRRLNEVVAERCPGAVVIAEESTAWPGVSAPVASGGLGFDYKWNMGWMHDTLSYMSRDPIHRSHHHHDMTFGLLYAFSERFVLPISHDEVVHGKGSLLGRMPGDQWQRLANLRAYLAFMWAHPGKKLLFMGCEIAQEREWNHDGQVDWHHLDDPGHRGIQRLVRDLNVHYTQHPALHARDSDPEGFEWVVEDDRNNSVLAFLRRGRLGDPPVLAVVNLTPLRHEQYCVGVPETGYWREVLNTDAVEYGGSGSGNLGGVTAEAVSCHGRPARLSLSLPPLSGMLFVLEGR